MKKLVKSRTKTIIFKIIIVRRRLLEHAAGKTGQRMAATADENGVLEANKRASKQVREE